MQQKPLGFIAQCLCCSNVALSLPLRSSCGCGGDDGQTHAAAGMEDHASVDVSGDRHPALLPVTLMAPCLPRVQYRDMSLRVQYRDMSLRGLPMRVPRLLGHAGHCVRMYEGGMWGMGQGTLPSLPPSLPSSRTQVLSWGQI